MKKQKIILYLCFLTLCQACLMVTSAQTSSIGSPIDMDSDDARQLRLLFENTKLASRVPLPGQPPPSDWVSLNQFTNMPNMSSLKAPPPNGQPLIPLTPSSKEMIQSALPWFVQLSVLLASLYYLWSSFSSY